MNTTKMKMIGLATAVVLPLGIGSEGVGSGEQLPTSDLEDCVDYFGDRAETNVSAQDAELVTTVGCAAMLSCATGETTTSYLSKFAEENQGDLAQIAENAIPSAETMVANLGLRKCVLREISFSNRDGTISYSTEKVGRTPDVFFPQ